MLGVCLVWEAAKAVDHHREAAWGDAMGGRHGHGYAAAWAFSEDGTPAAVGVGAGMLFIPSVWIHRRTPARVIRGSHQRGLRGRKVWIRVGRRASTGGCELRRGKEGVQMAQHGAEWLPGNGSKGHQWGCGERKSGKVGEVWAVVKLRPCA